MLNLIVYSFNAFEILIRISLRTQHATLKIAVVNTETNNVSYSSAETINQFQRLSRKINVRDIVAITYYIFGQPNMKYKN